MIGVLWGCVWRGGALGLAYGVALGAAYGALLLTGALVGESLGAALGRGGDTPHAWMYAAIVAPYGALYGAVLGLLAGPPLGTLLGLLVAAVVGVRALRRGEARRYRRFLGAASALVGPALLLATYAARGVDPAAFVFVDNTGGIFDGGPLDLVFVVLVPALAAGGAGWWLGRRLGAWCDARLGAPPRSAPSGPAERGIFAG